MGVKSTVFWDITPLSPLKVNWHFGGTYYLLVSCFAYSSTLKKEKTCSSEMSIGFQQTTCWCHILEDGTLHNHVYENSKSNIIDECHIFHISHADVLTLSMKYHFYGLGINSDIHIWVHMYIQNEKRKIIIRNASQYGRPYTGYIYIETESF
jgi:hypothetical protein